jgi:HAMP domain-containing protein
VKPRGVSLATQALVLQVAGLVAVVGTVGGTRYTAIRTQLHRGVEVAAENLVQVLEEMVAERPDFLQPGALDPVVDRFTYKLPSVSRVSLVGPGFGILADSRLPVGAPADQTALLPLLRDPGAVRFYYESGGERYLRWSRTLRGRYDPARRSDIVGAVSVDMRLGNTEAAIAHELTREMELVVVLLVPIGALLYVVTQRRFIRPLARLADAGARFARGDVPPRLTFNGSSELEVVARTFNHMVAERTRDLEATRAEVKTLQGILPICASCKRIKDSNGKWEAVESYVREHTKAEFSHGVCPECAARDWGAPSNSG